MPTVPGQYSGESDAKSYLEREETSADIETAANLGEPAAAASGEADAASYLRRESVKNRAALLPALAVNADEYAQHDQMARDSGIPVGVVQLNPKQFLEEQRIKQASAALDSSPTLSRWTQQDEANAAIANDDLAQLSVIEKAARTAKNSIAEIGGGFFTGLGQGAQGIGRLINTAARRVSGQSESAPWWAPSSLLKAAGGAVEAFGKTGEAPESERGFVEQTAGGLGQLAGQIATAMLTGGGGAAAIAAGQGAEQQGRQAEEAGATQDQQDVAVTAGAVITAAVERLGLGALLDRAPPQIKNAAARWIADKALAGGIEATQEGVEQVANNLVAQATYDPQTPIFAGAADSASLGGAVGALARTVLGIRIRGKQADEARGESESLQNLIGAAENSKLAARSPERFKSFLDALSDAGIGKVYAPIEAVDTLFQDDVTPEQRADALGISLQDYMEATLTGGDVGIAFGDFLTKLDKPSRDKLRDVIKASADGMTPEEAASVEQDAERFAQQLRDDGEAFARESDEQVYQDVLGQLLATNRYQTADAQAQARLVQSVFRTMGERSSTDSFELYSRYAPRISTELPAFLQKASIDVAIDPYLDALRTGKVFTDAQAYGDSMLDAMAKAGGLAHDSELDARDVGKQVRGLVKEGGMTLDAAAEWAAEQGYIRSANPDELLSAIDRSLSGSPIRSTMAQPTEKTQFLDVTRSLEREIEARGIDLDAMTNEQIREILAQGEVFDQAKRGQIQFGKDKRMKISLLENADLSTFLHESGHFFLEVFGDLASASNAEPQIKADYDAARAWLGLKEGQAITREHHEKWARGFEAYLREGKAPSAELSGAFARFSAWLKAIYRDLAQLNVELSDEVRSVFSRMIATDSEIQAATREMSYKPLFASAKQAGWTEAQFKARLKLSEDARDEAEAGLMARAMRDVTREQKAWWNAKSEEISKQVRAEAEQMPVFIAMMNMSKGRAPDGSKLADGEQIKLSKDWLLDRFGQEFLNKHLLRKRVYSQDGGISGDVAAGIFGFESGHKLVEAIANASDMDAYIKAETRQRMISQYGDMLTDGSLPKQAMASVHNTRQMQAIEADLKALERLANEKDPASSLGIRRVAERMLDGKIVAEVSPSAYLRAERKAAKEAIKAAGNQQWGLALAAQRRRLLNAHLFDLARGIEEQIEAGDKKLARLAKKPAQERFAKAKGDWLDVMNTLLHTVGARELGAVDKRINLERWADELEAQGLESPIHESVMQIADAAQVRPLSSLTVVQAREMLQTIANVQKQIGNANYVMRNERAVSWQEAQEALVAKLEETQPKGAEVFSDAHLGPLSKAAKGAGNFADMLLNPQTIIERLDGGAHGPWHDLFWNQATKSSDDRAVLRKKVLEPLIDEMRGWSPERRNQVLEDIPMQSLEGMSLKRSELIAMALNLGTPSNQNKLMRGGRWINGRFIQFDEDVIAELKEKLSKDDWKLVERVWGAVGRLWAPTVELQKRVGGLAPEQLETQDIDTPYGVIKGGYFPLIADRNQSAIGQAQASAQEAIKATQGIGRAATSKGRLKERTGVAYPLDLNLEHILTGRIDDVITDITHREFVAQANKVLADGQITSLLRSRMGDTAYESLKKAVARSIGDRGASDRATSSMDKLMDNVIMNLSSMALGFRFANGVANYGSAWSQAAARIGPARLVSAFSRTVGPKAFGEAETFVHSLSPYMATRSNELDSQLSESLRSVSGKNTLRLRVIRAALAYQAYFERLSSVPIWMAAFEQARDSGESAEQSVRSADKAVQQTQIDSRPLALSAFEGNKSLRLFKLFMGPMIIQGNRLRDAAAKKGVNISSSWPERFGIYLATMVIPAVLFDAVAGRIPIGDDEEDKLPEWLASKALLSPLTTAPILRDAAAFIESRLTGKPTFSRNNPVNDALDALLKAGNDILDAASGEDISGEKLTKDVAKAVGVISGAPVSAATPPVDFIYDVTTGEYEPKGVQDLRYLFIKRDK